jgi:4-amino-4-deoxy-L-arabinose transferase-like glycosyltransferase
VLAAILLLATGLNVVGLDREAYGNTYYAAAVKSMLTGWHNFFFASFDAGGFVSVDKPPVGLWVQAASAWLFGFNGLSLLLPQAIAGVLAVAALFYLVRRAFGPAAGLLAALALAVTPITVVTDRNNTMDSQLVLVLLLAVWAASLAAESGRLRPLLVCAALMGLAYNIKMLQAFLVLPALWAAYLLLAPITWRARVWRLALATIVLLAVSLSWSVVVDLTPASARPFVGSSGSNAALSLALGYNGLGRLTQAVAAHIPLPWLGDLTVDLTSAPGFAPGIGNPGLLRLFTDGLADQASWLLPLAILVLLTTGLTVMPWRLARSPWRLARAWSIAEPPTSALAGPSGAEVVARQWVGLVIWGLWLIGCVGYFSVARFYHIYYLIMLGPGVSALAGIGMATGWKLYRRGGYAAWLLPIGLVATATVQARILNAYPTWSGWLVPGALGGCVLAALVLIVCRRAADGRLAAVAAVVGSVVLLLAPAVWSVVSVQNNNGAAWLPQAGPSTGFGGPGGRPGGGPGGPGSGPGGPGGFGGGAPRFGGGPVGVQAPGGPAPFGQGGGFGPRPDGGGPGGRGPGGPGMGGPGGGGVGAMTFAGDQWNSLDPSLVQYLLANQGDAEFLVATPTSSYASLFMLATDRSAMALGGYQGWDRILTPDKLAELVSSGTVRFFLIGGGGGPGGGFGGPGPFGGGGGPNGGDGRIPGGSSQDATADLTAWVRASCTLVPAETWQSGTPSSSRGPGNQQLYDCAPGQS